MRRLKTLRADGKKLKAMLIGDLVARTGLSKREVTRFVCKSAVMKTYWKDPRFIMHYNIEYLVDNIVDEFDL